MVYGIINLINILHIDIYQPFRNTCASSQNLSLVFLRVRYYFIMLPHKLRFSSRQ